MNTDSWASILFALCAVNSLAACETDARPPSVLLISVDTLRRDHVSAYGYDRLTTPTLDALGREGAVFENASSTSNWTLPAHMSLLTGLLPSSHGVEDERDHLPPQLRTLAAAFRTAGYATGGFVSHIYLDEKYGFAGGFETYELVAEQRAEKVTARAIEWLEQHSDEAFFLFLHYFDPHWNYDPPAPFDRRFGNAQPKLGTVTYLNRFFSRTMPQNVASEAMVLYDGEIAYTDHHIGRVIDWLRAHERLDDTAVAVVSDHGEEFADHGLFGHGMHLHGEVTSVPMILRFPPRIHAGLRQPNPATIADLPATLLELAGIEPDGQFLKEAVALFAQSAPPGDRPRDIVSESSRKGPKRFAIQRGSYRFLSRGTYRPIAFTIRDGKFTSVSLEPVSIQPALYDLSRDPTERVNLIESEAMRAQRAELHAALAAYIDRSAGGVQIWCARDAGEEITGTVAFEDPLLDEPFSLSVEAPAVAEELDPTLFRLTLRPGAEEAGMVFPAGGSSPSVRVSLSGRDTPPFGGDYALSSPGEVHTLGSAGEPAGGCRIALRRPLESPDKGAVELDSEDIEALRALGYAR